MILIDWAHRLVSRFLDSYGPARQLVVIEGDSLPSVLPYRKIVLARDKGEEWCVGMRCPCGCNDTIELLLIAEARPRWDLSVDKYNRPTLTPSVWRRLGCGAHFWLRNGKIQWCR